LFITTHVLHRKNVKRDSAHFMGGIFFIIREIYAIIFMVRFMKRVIYEFVFYQRIRDSLEINLIYNIAFKIVCRYNNSISHFNLVEVWQHA